MSFDPMSLLPMMMNMNNSTGNAPSTTGGNYGMMESILKSMSTGNSPDMSNISNIMSAMNTANAGINSNNNMMNMLPYIMSMFNNNQSVPQSSSPTASTNTGGLSGVEGFSNKSINQSLYNMMQGNKNK